MNSIDIELEVIALRRKHIATWRNKPVWFWVLGLLEEVAEFILTLVGLHTGPPRWELSQISAICMNLAEVLEPPAAPDPNAPSLDDFTHWPFPPETPPAQDAQDGA